MDIKEIGRRSTSFLLATSMIVGMFPARTLAQEQISTRSNEIHYEIVGKTSSSQPLRYAITNYDRMLDDTTIQLAMSKWATISGGWASDDEIKKNPYAGQYILNFFNENFYKNIESIEIGPKGFKSGSGILFTKEADGALWKIRVNNKSVSSGTIGSITNHDIRIKLKEGTQIPRDKKISFTSIWTNYKGEELLNGHSNGYILIDNHEYPEEPENEREGNKDYLGTGMNGFETDGTKSKDGNFTEGNMGKKVIYDGKNKVIKSINLWKPAQNFKEANSAWVLYHNETFPKELLEYIDKDNVYIQKSDVNGNFIKGNLGARSHKLKVREDGTVTTKDNPNLSINKNSDWKAVDTVRTTLDKDIFEGALGQSRSYTIQYKIKDDVDNEEFAKALSKYIDENQRQLNFSSYLTADFIDETNVFLATRKPDGGKPNKRLQKSYAVAFLEVFDTDRDGLYDFLEDQLGTNPNSVDTDGDGVDDSSEYKVDKTDPNDASDYKVNVPQTEIKNIEAGKAASIKGELEISKYKNPANQEEVLSKTAEEAGNILIRLVKINEDGELGATVASTTIPLSEINKKDGLADFSIDLAQGNQLKDGEKLKLIAYSPNGKQVSVNENEENRKLADHPSIVVGQALGNVIIPKDDSEQAPEGYVEISFEPGTGNFADGVVRRYFVKKGISWEEAKNTNEYNKTPLVVPEESQISHSIAGMKFAQWRPSLPEDKEIIDQNASYRALFISADGITPKNNIDQAAPAGQHDVVFEAGEGVKDLVNNEAYSGATNQKDGKLYFLVKDGNDFPKDKFPTFTLKDGYINPEWKESKDENGNIRYTVTAEEIAKLPNIIRDVETYKDLSKKDENGKSEYARVYFQANLGKFKDGSTQKVYLIRKGMVFGNIISELGDEIIPSKEGHNFTDIWLHKSVDEFSENARIVENNYIFAAKYKEEKAIIDYPIGSENIPASPRPGYARMVLQATDQGYFLTENGEKVASKYIDFKVGTKLSEFRKVYELGENPVIGDSSSEKAKTIIPIAADIQYKFDQYLPLILNDQSDTNDKEMVSGTFIAKYKKLPERLLEGDFNEGGLKSYKDHYVKITISSGDAKSFNDVSGPLRNDKFDKTFYVLKGTELNPSQLNVFNKYINPEDGQIQIGWTLDGNDVKDIVTIPRDNTAKDLTFTAKFNALEIKAPEEKVKVVNINGLTEEEKEKVKEAIRLSNPSLADSSIIEVADNGAVTVKTSNGSVLANFSPDQTVEEIEKIEKAVEKTPSLDGMIAEDPTIKIKNIDENADNLTLKIGTDPETRVILTKGEDGKWTSSDPSNYPVEKDDQGNLIITPSDQAKAKIEDKEVAVAAKNSKAENDPGKTSEAKTYNIVDRTDLQAEADKENTVKADDKYKNASQDKKTAYDNALTKAKEVLEKEDASQDQINKALEELKKAEEALDGEAINKEALQAEAGKENTVKADDKYKNADSAKKDAYDNALDEAKKVLDNPNASQTEVDEALKNLQDAEKALDGEAINKEDLQAEADKENTVKANDKYKNADSAKKDAYDRALDEAKKVLDNPNASQDQINKALEELKKAEAALDGVEKTKTPGVTATNKAAEGENPGSTSLEIIPAQDQALKAGDKIKVSYGEGENKVEKEITLKDEDIKAGKIILDLGNEIPNGTQIQVSAKSEDKEYSDLVKAIVAVDKTKADETLKNIPTSLNESKEKEKAVLDAKKTLETLLKKEDASQKEIDEALKNLQDALDDLNKEETKVSKPNLVEKDDGSVEISPIGKNVKILDISYFDKTGNQIKLSAMRNVQGKWSLPENSGLSIDQDTGKITIPADKLKEGSQVVTTAKDQSGKSSESAEITVASKELTLKVPENKLNVEKLTNLTEAEKEEVKKAIRNANPDLSADAKISVGNDGSVTVEDGGKTASLKAADLVISKAKLTEEANKAPEIKNSDVYNNANQDKKDAYDKALDEAKKVLDNPNASQEQINEALEELKKAEAALDGSSQDQTDKTKLQAEVDKENTVKAGNKYNNADPVKKDAYDRALEYARRVLSDPNASQEDIDNAYRRLVFARDELNGQDSGGIYNSNSLKVRPRFLSDPIKDEPAKVEPKEIILEHRAYIKGYEDGSLKPDGEITRAEAAAMIARLKGLDQTNKQKANFTDTEDSWYNAAINVVVASGIMKGYEDGSFRPNEKITRAEFAQMIKPIDKQNDAKAPFADVKGHWAEKAIDQAYGNGRIDGYKDGSFRPDEKITRAEAAKILNAVFDRKVDQVGLKNEKDHIKHFSDLSESHWGYYELVEATNDHKFVRMYGSDRPDEEWREVIK